MAQELGERLLEVGLVTRAQLGKHGTQPHGAALARRLVDDGLFDDALAGFFVAEGFGPVQGPGELAEADPGLVSRLPAEMAVDFLVVPLRKTPSGVLVAMAVPSDRHLVREVARTLGSSALPTVARVRDLLSVLEARFPDVQPPPPDAEPEPIVLDLVRRRPGAEVRTERVTTNIRPPEPATVPADPPPEPAEDDAPLLLVRHKPIASRPRIDPAAIRREPPSEPQAPSVPVQKPTEPVNKVGAVVAKRFPAPQSRESSSIPYARGKNTTSEYGQPKAAEPPKAPAIASGETTTSSETTTSGETRTDTWDLPPPEPTERPSGKLHGGKLALPSNKGAAADATPMLAAMKTARDRDAIVHLACEAAITVGRSAVFLALRKGVLKGWDGAGTGVSRDSVRNLWIPTGSESMFKRVLDTGAPFVGAYGGGIADGLFRAAVGSRGGDVAVWPVTLDGKIVGLLCLDDLRPGSVSRHRVETITVAIAEGFRRLIQSGKLE